MAWACLGIIQFQPIKNQKILDFSRFLYLLRTKTGVKSMLFEKCDTPCDTHGPKPRIILRKNIFYYMIELPYVDGKRRFFRKSLHTDNFFEARQIVKMWVAQGLTMRKPKFPVFETCFAVTKIQLL